MLNMSTKRAASEQVAFRIEPRIASEWAGFVADGLIPNRAHLICAMLMYLSSNPEQRDVAQRAYARFQRSGELQLPGLLPGGAPALTADETDLLSAYRKASEGARDEAIANLLDKPGSSAHSNDSVETRDHRVG